MKEPMYHAVCNKGCHWMGQHWRVGDEYHGTAEPNHHFDILSVVYPEAPKKARKAAPVRRSLKKKKKK